MFSFLSVNLREMVLVNDRESVVDESAAEFSSGMAILGSVAVEKTGLVDRREYCIFVLYRDSFELLDCYGMT